MSDDETSKHIVRTYLDAIGAEGYADKYVDDLANLIDAARNAALEEAAKVADLMQESGLYRQMPHPAAVAAAIRELKDK